MATAQVLQCHALVMRVEDNRDHNEWCYLHVLTYISSNAATVVCVLLVYMHDSIHIRLPLSLVLKQCLHLYDLVVCLLVPNYVYG